MRTIPLLTLARLIGLPITLLYCAAVCSQSTAPTPWQTFASLEERPRALVTQDLSRLLFLRPRSLQDTGLPVDVWVEGRFHTTVLPGAFSEAEVCPGSRRIELASQSKTGPSPRSPSTVAAQSRQTVFVLIQTQAGVASQTPLSNSQAQALLPELRRQTHAVSRVPLTQDCLQAPAVVTVAERRPEPVANLPVAAPAAVPVPLPVVVPEPVALVSKTMPAEPAPARFTLSAEMLFNFAGSKPQHLSEQGQTQIVRLGKRIKEQLKPGQVIVVQGHTDPMGSAAMNQRLSLERAQTVSRILVNSGLPAKQLRAEGLGSSELLVKDCQKVAKTRDTKLNCNRPNRRVEINVVPAKN